MKTYIEIFKEVNDFTNQFLEKALPKLPILEYNTDTSVRHSNGSDDIVRTASNKEDVELQNKESVR